VYVEIERKLCGSKYIYLLYQQGKNYCSVVAFFNYISLNYSSFTQKNLKTDSIYQDQKTHRWYILVDDVHTFLLCCAENFKDTSGIDRIVCAPFFCCLLSLLFSAAVEWTYALAVGKSLAGIERQWHSWLCGIFLKL
jgi:hypothetical protein